MEYHVQIRSNFQKYSKRSNNFWKRPNYCNL